jgi:hypothetical protein
MICPNKICNQEIPDDSSYCDQCGIQILYCTKCGKRDITKFCRKCGEIMVFKETPKAAASSSSVMQPPPPVQETPQSQPAEPPSAATVVVQLGVHKLLFCHPDGWNMELTDGDILGRTSGRHTNRLGSIPVISGTHAKITHENDTWFITDQKSTNKTYVGGILMQPGVPAPIKNNDVVQLANVKFIVREP